MRHGIGIGVSLVGKGASGSVTIPGMFASGEKGFAYDLRTVSGLWQDAARTVAVASNNDPIAGVTDQSGLGNHGFNAAGTVRPLWSSSGYGVFDGVNDYLKSPAIDQSATSTTSVYVSFESLDTAGTSACIVYECGSPSFLSGQGRPVLYVNETVANRNTYGQNQTTPGPAIQTVYFTVSGMQKSIARYVTPSANATAGIIIRSNGTTPSVTVSNNGVFTGTTRANDAFYIGCRDTTSLFLNMRLRYILVINRALTSAEEAYLESL